MRRHADYVVIGAGIVGMAVARELALKGKGSVLVLEKESALGLHASGRNSGVIHSGINQKPGSLKGRMCVEGSRRLREFCRACGGVPMSECGTLVLARDEREEAILETLLAMGNDCGVPGLTIINAVKLKSIEPVARGTAALLSPTGATVDSEKLLEAVGADAVSRGVEILYGQEVVRIEKKRIRTRDRFFEAGFVVNCAGLHADRIAWMCGAGRGYRVIPFRGEYMEVKGCEVRGMIYQPPDLRFPFLSIHLTRETDGRVLAGPSAVPAFGREAYDKQWVPAEMAEIFFSPQFLRLLLNPSFLKLAFDNAKTSLIKTAFIHEVQKIAEGLCPDQFSPCRSGIRAQLVDREGSLVNDLLIEKQDGAIHILNAVSPGMTSSLAFAEYVAGQI